MNWLFKGIFKVVIVGVTVFFLTRYIEGIQIEDLSAAIFFSFLLAILNTFVRPVLVFVTLPISVVTLGLFLFVINTALFWFAGTFVEGVEIAGIFPALIGALIVSAVSWVFDRIVKNKDND